MRIFLLGFMGTGKTYWGQLWSQQHHLDFFDLDAMIEKESGMTIAQIFETRGEAYFREKERDTLRTFGHKDNFILSTGGGSPCFFDNMQWMNENGITVYLQSEPQILKERLVKEKEHRPLIKKLEDDEVLTFIKDNITKRDKFYNQSGVILNTAEITENTFTQIIHEYV
ncbi:MAG: shikimate kinase [Bacteroidetes bacterium]|nr:shikimate kinase [Bacteroidota bacterium]